MYLLICIFQIVTFVYSITNDISDNDMQYFSKCLDSSDWDSSVTCLVSQNYSSTAELQNLILDVNTSYTVMSNSTETFALTLNLKKIFVYGHIFFYNLKVLFYFFFYTLFQIILKNESRFVVDRNGFSWNI
jgi:hypothetical protein